MRPESPGLGSIHCWQQVCSLKLVPMLTLSCTALNSRLNAGALARKYEERERRIPTTTVTQHACCTRNGRSGLKGVAVAGCLQQQVPHTQAPPNLRGGNQSPCKNLDTNNPDLGLNLRPVNVNFPYPSALAGHTMAAEKFLASNPDLRLCQQVAATRG